MGEPGWLRALGEVGLAAWGSTVERLLSASASDETQRLRADPSDETPHLLATDWTGLPHRVTSCLGRQAGLALLDWPGTQGDEGRRRLQEEYLEWRTVRDPDGLVRRVELTTELPEYWVTLAGYAPAQVLATVAEFAREEAVDPAATFGRCDPFGSGTTAEDRMAAFADTMLSGMEGGSPYNTGAKAICCMVQPTNTLGGLAALARAALRTCTVEESDGQVRRCLTADAVLPLMRGLAVPHRASDPVLVERLTRLAWDGRVVAFDDPIGVYIQGAEHGRLRTPNGSPVPAEWFQFHRGLGAKHTSDGRARWQRATLEVPGAAGYAVGDLVDVATEEPITFGGQVADLIQVSVYLRVSDPGASVAEPLPMSAPPPDPATDGCSDVRSHQRALVA